MDYHMTDIIPLLPIPQPPYGKVSYNIPRPKCQSGSQHLSLIHISEPTRR